MESYTTTLIVTCLIITTEKRDSHRLSFLIENSLKNENRIEIFDKIYYD